MRIRSLLLTFLASLSGHFLASHSAFAETGKVIDLVVGEARSVPCYQCQNFVVTCAAQPTNADAARLLQTRNEVNEVILLFPGQSKIVAESTLRCGAAQLEQTELYVEFGCSERIGFMKRAGFTRHQLPIAVSQISNGQMNSEFQAGLKRFCANGNRDLYFSKLAGLPLKVTVRGQD